MRLGLPNIVLCKWEAILRKRSAAKDIFHSRSITISPCAMARCLGRASRLLFVALLSRLLRIAVRKSIKTRREAQNALLAQAFCTPTSLIFNQFLNSWRYANPYLR
jgi:hypothetical protein